MKIPWLSAYENIHLWDNSISSYIESLVWFLVLLLAFYIGKKIAIIILRSFAKRTKTEVDNIVLRILQTTYFPFYLVIAFLVALYSLHLPRFVEKATTVVLVTVVTVQVLLLLQIIVDYFIKKFVRRRKNHSASSAIENLGIIIKALLWIIGVFFVLSNVGVNITSLVAGLGIGGIAIAFALQNILGDLFSSFAIYFDKPFVVGDFIVVGDKMGVVEKIGIKTTRIRALQGEEIVISNQQLTSAEIQNFKRMHERRILFTLGITYETEYEKLKRIPAIIQSIITDIKGTKFDRAHFFAFGDASLVFEVVYFVKNSDYNIYMDIQQKINLAIKKELDKRNIKMVYPPLTAATFKRIK